MQVGVQEKDWIWWLNWTLQGSTGSSSYAQQHELDYDEMFCPVVRFESLRSVISIAVQHDMHLHQMDFTAAFLNGDLSEEVYMKQPTGFIKEG